MEIIYLLQVVELGRMVSIIMVLIMVRSTATTLKLTINDVDDVTYEIFGAGRGGRTDHVIFIMEIIQKQEQDMTLTNIHLM